MLVILCLICFWCYVIIMWNVSGIDPEGPNKKRYLYICISFIVLVLAIINLTKI